jgi:hypothetical protein
MPNNKKQKEIKSSTPTSNESSSTNRWLRRSTRTCKQVIGTLSEDQKKLDSSEIRYDLLLTDDLLLSIDTDNQQTPDKLLENREKLVSSEILPESSFTNTNAALSQMSPDKSPENREKLVSSEILPESSFTDTNAAELQMLPDKSPENREKLVSSEILPESFFTDTNAALSQMSPDKSPENR